MSGTTGRPERERHRQDPRLHTWPDSLCGVSGLYAAAGVTVGRELVLTGGMRADSTGHRPVAALRKLGKPRYTIVFSIAMNIMTSPITISSRKISMKYLLNPNISTNWRLSDPLEKPRAFHCAVNLLDSGLLVLGGLTVDGPERSAVEQSGIRPIKEKASAL